MRKCFPFKEVVLFNEQHQYLVDCIVFSMFVLVFLRINLLIFFGANNIIAMCVEKTNNLKVIGEVNDPNQGYFLY